jgi:hypothetical protein
MHWIDLAVEVIAWLAGVLSVPTMAGRRALQEPFRRAVVLASRPAASAVSNELVIPVVVRPLPLPFWSVRASPTDTQNFGALYVIPPAL